MKKSFFLTLFLFLSIFLNAQNNNSVSKKLPTSIYTFSTFNSHNDVFLINKKLNIGNYDFVLVNQLDLDLNRFSFNFKDIGKEPSEFIYYDYKRYLDRNLLKGFLLKNDPTRWFPNNFKNTQ